MWPECHILKKIVNWKGFLNSMIGSKVIQCFWYKFLSLNFKILDFLWIDPLGRFSHRVAISVCMYVCISPPSEIYFQASHRPTGDMTTSQASNLSPYPHPLRGPLGGVWVWANERPGNKFHWEGTYTHSRPRTSQLHDLIGPVARFSEYFACPVIRQFSWQQLWFVIVPF